MAQEKTHAMESAAAKPSPSFRLRNGSLNALRLRRVFDVFDRNGDGEITLDEMTSAFDALGLRADRSGLEAAVGSYIPAAAGAAGLRFDDFVSLHRALGDALFGPIPEAEPGQEDGDDEEDGDMKEAFRVFDEDGDGFISAAELQAVLEKLGLPEARSMATVTVQEKMPASGAALGANGFVLGDVLHPGGNTPYAVQVRIDKAGGPIALATGADAGPGLSHRGGAKKENLSVPAAVVGIVTASSAVTAVSAGAVASAAAFGIFVVLIGALSLVMATVRGA